MIAPVGVSFGVMVGGEEPHGIFGGLFEGGVLDHLFFPVTLPHH